MRTRRALQALGEVRTDKNKVEQRTRHRHPFEISSMYEVAQRETVISFEHDYEEYLRELGPLSHKPISGPRDSHIGENVFSFEWETLNEITRTENDPPNIFLASILFGLDRRLTQRHASVAASFITWLGTNCGAGFLSASERRYKRSRGSTHEELERGEAYLCEWALYNRRTMHGRSSPFRLIESILASEDERVQDRDLFMNMWGLKRAPNLSAEDYETVEIISTWLGTTTGQYFIRRCEHLVKVRQQFSSPIDTIKVIAGVMK